MKHSPDTSAVAAETQLLRYVVLRHEGAGVDKGGGDLHWDLMLEVAGQEKLATWQIHMPPERWAEAGIGVPAAKRIGDHRRIYLVYEGVLSGDRGSVVRVAAGMWRLIMATPAAWHVELRGNLALGLILPLERV